MLTPILADITSPQTAATGTSPTIFNFAPIILIFIIFYFLVFRPQKKSQNEHAEMLKTLSKNDEVVTTSGIHGTIVNVKDETVIVRVDDGVKLEMDKAAVTKVKKKAKN